MDKQWTTLSASIAVVLGSSPLILEAVEPTSSTTSTLMRNRVQDSTSFYLNQSLQLDASKWSGRTAFLTPKEQTSVVLTYPESGMTRLDLALEGGGERTWVSFDVTTNELTTHESGPFKLALVAQDDTTLTLSIEAPEKAGYYSILMGSSNQVNEGVLTLTGYTLAVDTVAPTGTCKMEEESDSISGYRIICAGLEDAMSGVYRVYQRTTVAGHAEVYESDAVQTSSGVWDIFIDREYLGNLHGDYQTDVFVVDRAGNEQQLTSQVVNYQDWTTSLTSLLLSKDGTLSWGGTHYYPAYEQKRVKATSVTELRGLESAGQYQFPMDSHYGDQVFQSNISVRDLEVGRYQLVHKVSYESVESNTTHWATPSQEMEMGWVGFGNGKKGRLQYDAHESGMVLEIAEDLVAPVVTLTPSTTEETTEYITLLLEMADEEGLASIETPSGTYVFKPETSYITTENGTYTFVGRDLAGNETQAEQVIENYARWATESPISLFYQYKNGSVFRDWTKVPSNGLLTIVEEGVSTIFGQARDEAGNVSTIEDTQVRIDLTKPDVSFTVLDDYDDNLLKVSLFGEDDHSGVAYFEYKLKTDASWTRVSAGGFNESEVVITLPPVSGVELQVRAIDGVGWVSDIVSDVIYFDQTPPDVTFVVNPNWESLEVKPVTIQINDPHSGIAYIEIVRPGDEGLVLTDFTAGDKSYEKTFQIDVNNGYQLGVIATDVVGNQTDIIWVDILKDNITPELSALTAIAGGIVIGNNIYVNSGREFTLLLDMIEEGSGLKETQVMFTALDGSSDSVKGTYHWANQALMKQSGSGFNVLSAKEVTGEYVSRYYLQMAFEALRPGVPYALSYRLTDNALNTTGDVLSPYQVILDNTAPTVVLDGNEDWTNAESVSFTLQAQDDDSGSGLAMAEYRLVNQLTDEVLTDWTTLSVGESGAFSFNVYQAGQIRVEARGTDYAGNVSAVVSKTARIDRLAPKTTIQSVDTWQKTSVNVQIRSEDGADESGLALAEYRLSGAEEKEWTRIDVSGSQANTSFTVSGVGTTLVEVRTHDVAGNVSLIESKEVKIETTEPSVYIETEENWTNADAVPVKVVAVDADSGLHAITYRLNGGAEQSLSVASPVFNLTQEGVTTVSAYAEDKAGNKTSEPATAVVRIDRTNPTLDFKVNGTSVASLDWVGSAITIMVEGADTLSGVASILLPNGQTIYHTSTQYTVTAAGTYRFVVTDYAGNQTTKELIISQPATDAPDISISGVTSWTNADEVIMTLSGTPANQVTGLEYDLKGATIMDWEYVEMTPNKNPNQARLYIRNEGTTTIQARVQNRYGIWSGIRIASVNIDRTAVAPTVQVASHWNNQNPLPVTIYASDSLSGISRVEYRFAKTDEAMPSTWTRLAVNWASVSQTTLNWTEQGDYTLEVRLIDVAGNVSDVTTARIRSDYTAPTLTLTESGAYTNGNVVIDAHATDIGGSEIAHIRYRLVDDATGGVMQDWTKTPVVLNHSSIVIRYEGVIRVEAYAVDHAGNESSKVSTVVRISRLAPVLNLTATTSWQNKDVSIQVNAIDQSNAGIDYIELPDGTKYYGASTTYVAKVKNTYTFKAVDKAGNETEGRIAILIDRDYPNLTVTVDEGWTNQSSVTAIIEATDNTSDIKTIEYRLNGTGWKTLTGSSLTISEIGETTLEVRATDLAGNTTTAPKKTIRIANGAPALMLTPDKEAWTNESVYVDVLAVSTSAAPVSRLALPNGTVVFTNHLTYRIEQNGVYRFQAVDEAGNVTTEELTISNIDKEGPIIALSHDGNTAGMNDYVTLTAHITDAASGLASITFPDGSRQEVSGNSQEVQFTVSLGGTYVFTATDVAGNLSTHAITVHNVGGSNLKLNLSQHDAAILYQVEKIDANGAKFYRVQLPNGLYSYKTSDTYVATKDGLYTFIAYDVNLNETRESIYIQGIGESILDTTAPTHVEAELLDYEYQDEETYWVQANNRFDIRLRGADNASGIYLTNLRLTSLSGAAGTLQVEHVFDSNPTQLTEWQTTPALAALGVKENIRTDYLAEAQFSLLATTDNESYRVYASYTDAAKNESAETELPFTVKVDGVAPTGVSHLSSNTISNPLISVVGTDTGSGMDYIILPTGEKVSGNTATYQAQSTGRYEFILVDKVGNQTKLPVYVVGSTGDISNTMVITKNPDIELALKAADIHPEAGATSAYYGSGVQAKRFKTNNGAWGSWIVYSPNSEGVDVTSANILTDGGLEGINTYYTQVHDFATNYSSVVEAKVLLDQTGPVITRFTAQPKYTNNDQLTVQISATDNFEEFGLTNVQYIALSNDEKTWTLFNVKSLPAEIDWTVPVTDSTPNTYYRVYAKAIDSLGNEGAIAVTEYGVDTIAPTGTVVIGDGSDYAASKTTHLTLAFGDNFSGVESIKIYDKGSDASLGYIIENPEGESLEVPWVLKPQTLDGKQIAQVVMEVTDRAGNTTRVESQQVIVMDLSITTYTMLDVVNPHAFTPTNPFRAINYPNFGAQPMVAGGDYTYEVIYDYDGLAVQPDWHAVYTVDYEMVDASYRYTDQEVFTDEAIDGHFMSTYTLPYALQTGANIYTSVKVEIFDGSGNLLAYDRLPTQEGALIHIGYIEGSIRELLQFNEIN